MIFTLYANNISTSSVSCRLPQTPRTPSVGMMHYFDDTFSRHITASGTRTPSTPSMPRIRRSSTARSLAVRSDFSNGTEDYEEEDDGAYTPRRSSHGSVLLDADPLRAKERADADAHMNHYITEQLERVRSQRSEEWLTPADEIEAGPE